MAFTIDGSARRFQLHDPVVGAHHEMMKRTKGASEEVGPGVLALSFCVLRKVHSHRSYSAKPHDGHCDIRYVPTHLPLLDIKLAFHLIGHLSHQSAHYQSYHRHYECAYCGSSEPPFTAATTQDENDHDKQD
jgi:hypothetical protein